MREVSGLRAALLIDKGEIEEAKEMLRELVKETFSENERDTEVVVLSLLGLL